MKDRDDYLLTLEIEDQLESALYSFEEHITGQDIQIENWLDEQERKDKINSNAPS